MQPGSTCNLPDCTAQTLSWGGGCQASFPATHVGVTATGTTTAGTGTATATCNAPGGGSGWSSPTGLCTPPLLKCPVMGVSWSQPQDMWENNPATQGNYTCSGAVSGPGGNPADSGSYSYPSQDSSTRVGSATYLCTNGNWILQSGLCNGKLRPISVPLLTPGSGWGSDNDYINCYVQGLHRYPATYEKTWNSGAIADCSFIWGPPAYSPEYSCVKSQGGGYGYGHICSSSEAQACGSTGFAYSWNGATTGSCKSVP